MAVPDKRSVLSLQRLVTFKVLAGLPQSRRLD